MLEGTFRSLVRPRRPLVHLAALTIALLAVTWLRPGPAHARGARSYCFLLSEIQLADDIPGEVADMVRERLAKAIAAHERLVGALPEGAPDPKEAPRAFRRYARRHGLAPFRVNVEVTQYRHETEPAPRGNGQRLAVGIALRLFGETIPKRVIAFSGEGSATVKLEIGKRLRARDSEVARREATTQAVADALATSIQRLDQKAGRKKK